MGTLILLIAVAPGLAQTGGWRAGGSGQADGAVPHVPVRITELPMGVAVTTVVTDTANHEKRQGLLEMERSEFRSRSKIEN